jgi:hypothetical protein
VNIHLCDTARSVGLRVPLGRSWTGACAEEYAAGGEGVDDASRGAGISGGVDESEGPSI